MYGNIYNIQIFKLIHQKIKQKKGYNKANISMMDQYPFLNEKIAIYQGLSCGHKRTFVVEVDKPISTLQLPLAISDKIKWFQQ